MNLLLVILKIAATGMLFIDAVVGADWNISCWCHKTPFWQELVFYLFPNLVILAAIWL